MATPLRVLLIEDSDDDAALLLRELRRGGYAPQWTRVDTAEGLTAALAEGGWDLVTCDWVMPRFSALRALEQLRAAGDGVPVLIVSGEIGEEVAVSALKNGAHDFVSKHRLTRLLPAVERELREHAERRARRRAEASLQQARERLRLFVERASDIIFTLDRGGVVTSVNPAVTASLGYAPDELIGRNVADLVPPGTRPAVLAALARMWEGGEIDISVFEVGTKSGARRLLEVSGRALTGAGEPAESFHIGRDVTEQRRLERERARLGAALEQAPEPIAITDEQCRIIYMNAACERLTGQPRSAAAGQVYTVVPLDRRAPVSLDRLLGADGTWSGRIVQAVAGGEVHLELDVSPIRDRAGRIVNYVSRLRRVRAATDQAAAQ